MNKKYFKTALTIIVLITIVSIGALSLLRYYAPLKNDIIYTENLNKKDLDLVISDYIKNYYFNWSHIASKEKYEAHKIYGIDEKFGLKYVYIYTLYEAYETNNNEKESIAGGANPLVIIMKEDSNGIYSVVNHKEPMSGESYSSSLKIIFPNKYVKNIKEAEILKELKEKINSNLM